MTYHRKLTNSIALIIVMGIAGGALVATGLATIPFSVIGDELSEGYEGAKCRWEGIDVQPNPRVGVEKRIIFRIGDEKYPVPTNTWKDGLSNYQNPSTWSFRRGDFNIDPDVWDAGLHNLVGVAKGGGVLEKIPGSNEPLTKKVSWDIVVANYPNGSKAVKHVEAKAFFFEQEVEIKPKVDESLGWFNVIINSEKGGYWGDFAPILLCRVKAWDPLGNHTSWARLLGVEVADVDYVQGVNTIKDEAFFQSQMLTLYKGFDFAVSSSGGVASKQGDSAVEALKGRNLDPSGGDLITDAYVALPYSSFGVNSKGQFADWVPNQHIIKLRVHVLKVDEWIAVQQVGSKFEPTDPKGVGFENPVFAFFKDWVNGMNKWLQNPFNMLGLMGIILTIVIIVAALLLGLPVLKAFLAYKVISHRMVPLYSYSQIGA